MSGENKKLFVQSWGCQMNVYDSQRMADLVLPQGYALTDEAAAADLIILNTCHIREKASEKLFSELGRLNEHKKARARAGEAQRIAVAGCVAQALGEEIVRRAPFVDVVVGPQTYHDLPALLARNEADGEPQVAIDMPEVSKFDHLPGESAPRGAAAFLSIQEGCDKFCTFCVVPYTRGAEASRPAASIVKEAQRLVQAGAQEITLLGQNVNAWHGAGPDGAAKNLAWLLHVIATETGVARLRYTTSHPRDMDAALIRAHAELPALMPFLHLPVQSGSDRILRAMNRKHTAAEYLDIIAQLRAARPDLALSSDFIVGFPGETEEDFADTLALVERVGFASAYSFKYSPRPGTPAATAEDPVPEAVKDARLQQLQALLRAHAAAFNASCIGQTVPVLLDRSGQKAGQLLGRTPYNQSVHVDAPAYLRGRILDVRIESATASSLKGAIPRLDAPQTHRPGHAA